MRTGTTDLPLHSGKAPRWLFSRMVRLSRGISGVLLREYGREELLRRLADPFWFQALACVLGFDWHSSGTTTTTCGALKEALDPEEYGIAVAGGKGRKARGTLREIEEIGDLFSLSSRRIERLQRASRMAAKVDSACIQDGYTLYHHAFVFTEGGRWAVVQQGMGEGGYARRYHWLSESVRGFVEAPHEAICGERREIGVLDMTAAESAEAREASLDLCRESPGRLLRSLSPAQRTLGEFSGGSPALLLPRHHAVGEADLGRRGLAVLRSLSEIQPESYEELLSLRGVGSRTLRALALLSDLLYGARASWRDPVQYSFAHGGKDGHPFPVDREVYDASIRTLEGVVREADLGKDERRRALRRLSALLPPV
jgi:hypothetical protein